MLNLLPGLVSCTGCYLASNGLVVPGDGPIPCQVMVIGEAPGAQEAMDGRPFIGQAGRFLDELMRLAGYEPGSFYKTNSAKHWPGNENPKPKTDALKACRQWLDWEIEMVDPDLIICVGDTAASNILGKVSIKRIHGTGIIVEDLCGRRRTVFVTYHPAAGFHAPGLRPTIEEDFRRVKTWIADYHQMEVGWLRGVSDLRRMLDMLHPYLSLDLETTSLDVSKAEITAVGLSSAPHLGFTSQNLSLILPVIQGFFDSGLPILAHNGAYDLPILERYGLRVNWKVVWDTMISGYILGKDLALKTRALREHKIRMETYGEVAGTVKDSSLVDPWRLLPYNACDAAVTALLYEHDRVEIEVNGAAEGMGIERDLTPILLRMQNVGQRWDREKAVGIGVEFQAELDRLAVEIKEVSGYEFNVGSTQQVSWLLFDKLHLKPVKRTKGGDRWSTDEEVLKARIGAHPVVPLILNWRKYEKVKGTYIDSPLELSAADGRLHTEFVQTGARGGRMSSRKPNAQNQPSRGKWGRLIRGLYLPDNDNEVLLACDAGQLELRVAASLSGDGNMMAIFNGGRSIHIETLHTILMRPDLGKGSDEYGISKNVNFGMTYRMTARGLQRYLATECEPPILLSLKTCQEIGDRFLNRFPELIAYQDRLIADLKEKGYVENVFHYRRYLPEVFSDDQWIVEDACKIGVNLPIQGSAGVAIKRCMTVLKDYPMRNNVHDELVFSVPIAYVEDVARDVQRIMEESLEEVFGMKMVVECGWGQTWADCK